jgi:hypothetical protein
MLAKKTSAQIILSRGIKVSWIDVIAAAKEYHLHVCPKVATGKSPPEILLCQVGVARTWK